MTYTPTERVRRAIAVAAIAAAGMLVPVNSSGQAPSRGGRGAAPPPARPVAPLEVIQLRDNFYAVVGAGATVGMQVGPDGVILVDSGSGERSADVVARSARSRPRPIRYIINTSAQREHVGRQRRSVESGAVGDSYRRPQRDRRRGRSGADHGRGTRAGAMTAPTGEQAPFPVGAWPT
jgi:glyoxylase-like metal-dependent hydrolase (beta-lactamase superfamily II)